MVEDYKPQPFDWSAPRRRPHEEVRPSGDVRRKARAKRKAKKAR